MNLKEIVPLEWRGQRVLTVKQLAQAFGYADISGVHKIALKYKDEFVEGEHYFNLAREEFAEFRSKYPNLAISFSAGIKLFPKVGVEKIAFYSCKSGALDVYKWLAENCLKQAPIAEISTPSEIAEPPTETALQVFSNEEFGDIRTAGTADNPKFCLADVCRSLEIGNPSDVKNRLEDGVVTIEVIFDSLGRLQKAAFVNEDGLYDVILDSRKPSAKKFRKWITSEVLPSIRKTGEYKINPAPAVPVPATGITPSALVWEVGKTRDAIKSVFGIDAVKEGIALAKSVDMVGKHYNADLSELNTFLPSATHKVGHLTATMIGKKLGISAQAVNEMLRAQGLQYRDKKGNWILTDAGAAYGEMIPYTNKISGHTGYYPLWNDSVLRLFDDNYILPF